MPLDLYEVGRELNDRFAGRALDDRGLLEVEIRSFLASCGVRAGRVVTQWDDESATWTLSVQLLPEPEEIVVMIDRVPLGDRAE